MNAYELIARSLHNIDGIQICQYDSDMGETIDIVFFTPAQWNSREAADFRTKNVKHWYLQLVFDHSHFDDSVAVNKCVMHIEIW